MCGVLSGFCRSVPCFCFPLCISLIGACLFGGLGAHSWVVRSCQPLVQSPSQDVLATQPPHNDAVVYWGYQCRNNY